MSTVKDFYPLSPMQEGMLFHSLMDQGSGVYVKQGTYTLSGELNIPALERAWQDVVDRFAILRTFFLWGDLEKPIQVVQSKVPVTLHQEDWSDVPEAEAQRRLYEFYEADRVRGFDLSQPPLIRMTLIVLGRENYRLVWTWHHILIDGWSEGLLDKALFELYSAHSTGRKPQLPRSRPFRDYIRWLQQQELPKAEAFWRRTLQGFTRPSALARSLTAEEQSQPSPPYKKNGVMVSEETTSALNAFTRTHRLTLSTLLKGAWSLILSKYCDQQDVVLGSVVSGRPTDLEGVEQILGMFVNTLPMRVRIAPDQPLLSWLKDVQTQQAETLQYEYSPLQQIQKWSDIPRGVPLFESIVAFDMASIVTSASESTRTLETVNIKIGAGGGTLQISNPLSILVHTGAQLFIGMSYDTRLFADDLIDQLLADFNRLLENFVAHPERSISSFLAQIGPDRAETDELAELIDRSNLTRNQFMIWLGQKLNGDAPVYNIPVLINLTGHFEPDHLRNAWRTLVNSSDALRTIFEEDEAGAIRQRVLPSLQWEIEEFDFSREPDPIARLSGWLRDRSRATLAMNQRLFDCALIKMSEQSYTNYFNSHQLICDAWSEGIIARQLMSFYERSLTGELSEKQELGQYVDYVDHERKLRSSPQYQEAHEFWQRELAEEAEPLAFYGKQPVKHTADVERVVIDLGAERSRRLKEIATSEGIFQLSHELTLFSVFVSLSSAFLYRITGTPRIPLGVYYHNRNGFRDTIGLFMHVHPMRVTVEDGDTFQSLIKRTQSEYRRISRYRHYPVANPARKPAYDVLINYTGPPAPTNVNGASVQYEWLHAGHGLESLNIELIDYKWSSRNFELGIKFHRDVFSEQRRRDAARHFLQLVDCFLTDSTQRVAFAALLTEKEREQLVVRFNQTRREYEQDQTIVGQFESQAEQAPEKIALEVDGRTLTYAELDARANQLAHALRRRGVGHEIVVGICTERSLELIIGILGVLKAGAAFVPLDPTYPRERLAFMLDDSRAEVLLTQQHLLPGLSQHEITSICLDSDWPQIAAESTEKPGDGPAVDNLAYVIYTSGSTGKPKGTMIQHGSLFDYTQTATREYSITADDRVLQFCSLSFDTSIEEIIPCLSNGATLVLRTEEMLASVPTFLELCEQWAITFISLPTAYWHEMTEVVSSSGLSLPPVLRMVVIAGERVLPERLTAWQHIAKRPLLINTYGLTESTIVSTAVELSHLPFDGGEVPIGPPISNTQLYVLDKNFEPVPVNMPGELQIGGNLLARGYYRRPDVTAERFVPNPFSNQPGARLYRTGDLAKFPTKDTLEFIGRRDHQVKIRGFRIELEEVAGAIRQHPNTRDCAVVLREDTPGRKQLIAYVVPRQQPATTSSDLREFLAQNLPDYMLPAVFMTLDALPLTPNGKIDLAALPAPTRSDDNIYAGPLTRIERDLGEIWASVLGLDRVGIHDNYFELGGDSIRSIQIRAKAQRLGIEFTVQDLFQQQTIQALARVSKLSDPGAIPLLETAPFSLLTEEDREKLPEGVEDAFPLARLQAGMVFHNLYHENSDLYIDVSSLHLELPFDLKAMQLAINQMIARHPILRTTFDLSSYSEPLQLVWPEALCPLAVHDIRHLRKEEQDQFLKKFIDEETRRQFDLTEVPLIRFIIHRRTDTSCQVTWSNHHAILDGWSMAVMLTELFQLFLAHHSGKESKIGPPPSVSYREFVALEREVLNSNEAQQYLSETVRGLTVTTMPRRPGARPGIPETLTVQVLPPAELCEELKQLALSTNIPVKSFVLAAQMKMLSMVSGHSDVTTGMVVSGRPEREDGDRVLGLFTNTIPVRMNLTGGSWMELVQRVFELEGELLPYRRFPISELKTLEGGQVLFETMFNFTHFFLYKTVPRVSGAQVHGVDIRGASNYVFVTDCNQDFSSSQFELALTYDASLVDRQQTQVIRGYFLKILESMVRNPHGRYELMSLLSEDERKQLVVEWNNTSIKYPDEKPIHEVFEAQAERMGNTVAVVYEDQQLTYDDLNRRANQLAHHLRRLGVGPEVLVGVAAERSVEMMIALLGILKAGGAYVPIDPSYPATRVEYMLADSGVSIVLTQSHLLDQLPQTGARLISLDDWSAIAAESDENPAVNVKGDNSIYMIYTSGSTGQPKGALNTHSGLFNRLTWMQQQYELTPDDRVLQKTPFSFDVSVWEFFWPVITGARLVFAKPGGHQDRSYLIELINQAQITTCHFVPSMLQAFLDDPEVSTCRSLRQVMSSGEALSYDLQQRFFERLGARLHNLYGPTEAAIDVTFWECRANEERSVPIGRPVANTEIYLLDPSMQSVPVGAPGELYIGGVQLARAYHRRPELTAQQFIPHPFSHASAHRLYKTGDLARYRTDGAIEYIGRSDHQVKIRGFRIELGEIEAALRECENVKDLIVQTQQDSRGDVMLVAYVVYDHEPAPKPADIREFLKHKLPEHMIPAAFVMMSSFPLTANGKVNRRALATMRPEKLETEHAYVGPRTPIELRLVAIWEDVFNLRPIGVEDSFFDLGGHSILALRLMAQVQKEFGQNLPLSTLSEAGDIAHLAEIISGRGVATPPSLIVPIQPKGSKPPIFCVHPLGGHVMRYYELAQLLGTDQPFYGVQGRDVVDISEDYQSLEELARAYVKAMRETQPTGPYQLGGYSFGSFVAFEMAQQLMRAGEEVSLLFLLDTWSPSILRLLPELDKDALLLNVISKEVAMRMGKTDFAVSVSELEAREGEAQLSFFLEQVRKGGLVPDEISDDVGMVYLRGLLTGIRTRGAAWRNYEADVYPGKITVIRCNEQEPFLYNTLAEFGADVEDPTAGWRWLSEEPVEVHFVPGYHERMMMQPSVGEVAKVLAGCIERPFVPQKSESGIAARVLGYFRR